MNCHTGDKDPYHPDSDDQFTVWDWAIRKGLDPTFHRVANEASSTSMGLTVPGYCYLARPFDLSLHRLAEQIRRGTL